MTLRKCRKSQVRMAASRVCAMAITVRSVRSTPESASGNDWAGVADNQLARRDSTSSTRSDRSSSSEMTPRRAAPRFRRLLGGRSMPRTSYRDVRRPCRADRQGLAEVRWFCELMPCPKYEPFSMKIQTCGLMFCGSAGGCAVVLLVSSLSSSTIVVAAKRAM